MADQDASVIISVENSPNKKFRNQQGTVKNEHSIFWRKTDKTLSYRPVQRGGAPPKIDCQVSAWSEWTDCTVSCGVGWTTVIRTPKNECHYFITFYLPCAVKTRDHSFSHFFASQ